MLRLKQAAEYLGYSESGLRKLVRKPGGPPYHQASKGACLMFVERELDEWLASTRKTAGATLSIPRATRRSSPAGSVDWSRAWKTKK